MVNEGHGLASGGTDRPTAAQEIDLMIGIDAASKMQRQVKIQQTGVGTGTQHSARFFLRLGAGVMRR
jgi:hypothetical protein